MDEITNTNGTFEGDDVTGEKQEHRVYICPKGGKIPKHLDVEVIEEGSLIERVAEAERCDRDAVLVLSDKEMIFLSGAQEFLSYYPIMLMGVPESTYTRSWYMYQSQFNAEQWGVFATAHEPARARSAFDTPVAKDFPRKPTFVRKGRNRQGSTSDEGGLDEEETPTSDITGGV